MTGTCGARPGPSSANRLPPTPLWSTTGSPGWLRACETSIRTAAVLGPEFDPRLLATVVGADAADVGRGLSAAVEAGLLTREPDGDVRWRHALTCAAVLGGLTTPERAAIAARAAEALDEEQACAGRWSRTCTRGVGVRFAPPPCCSRRRAMRSPPVPWPPRTRSSDMLWGWPPVTRACSQPSRSSGSRRSPWRPDRGRGRGRPRPGVGTGHSSRGGGRAGRAAGRRVRSPRGRRPVAAASRTSVGVEASLRARRAVAACPASGTACPCNIPPVSPGS